MLGYTVLECQPVPSGEDGCGHRYLWLLARPEVQALDLCHSYGLRPKSTRESYENEWKTRP